MRSISEQIGRLLDILPPEDRQLLTRSAKRCLNVITLTLENISKIWKVDKLCNYLFKYIINTKNSLFIVYVCIRNYNTNEILYVMDVNTYIDVMSDLIDVIVTNYFN